MDVVVVGATGAVGQVMLKVLEERRFPVGRLRLVASARSAGRVVEALGQRVTLEVASPEVFSPGGLALFSAGAGTSQTWCPVAAERGALAVDNSSAWRMDPSVPLVVPEVNSARITPRGIIANPNCSTIQMLVALKPLHDAAGLEQVVVSTYQAISGKGARALEEFELQRAADARGETPNHAVLPGVLSQNLLTDWKHEDSGWAEEELKMIQESRKILELPALRVTPTCVRVPVPNGHSEAVWARFSRPIGRDEALALLGAAPGISLDPRVGPGLHPQPRSFSGRDDVAVGRVRVDPSDPHALAFWVVGDNLRKGAATNAVQIAEHAFGVR
ncbi:MAG: aspartate-semialdehyde dehydrogenase [Myxococcales bacterium]|nr:aspartate-semialdehyde dehydrogenase [Myxococcales bacterium]